MTNSGTDTIAYNVTGGIVRGRFLFYGELHFQSGTRFIPGDLYSFSTVTGALNMGVGSVLELHARGTTTSTFSYVTVNGAPGLWDVAGTC
jgi:hypothetical protein